VKDVIDNVAPELKAVEFKFMSEPDVPTEPSASTTEPPDSAHRNHDATPEVAIVTLAIAAAVRTPLFDVIAADAGSVTVASKVPEAAVSGVVGWVPE
jgi:hypothetical protein